MSALAVAAAMRRRLLGEVEVTPVKIEFKTSNADFAEDGRETVESAAARGDQEDPQRPRPRHGKDFNGNSVGTWLATIDTKEAR